jgi:nucleoid DNA-binding protein
MTHGDVKMENLKRKAKRLSVKAITNYVCRTFNDILDIAEEEQNVTLENYAEFHRRWARKWGKKP